MPHLSDQTFFPHNTTLKIKSVEDFSFYIQEKENSIFKLLSEIWFCPFTHRYKSCDFF